MKNIQAGDVVMVVRARPCCASNKGLGCIYRVHEVRRTNARCRCCGDERSYILAINEKTKNRGFPLGMLKRILPLSEMPALDYHCDVRPRAYALSKVNFLALREILGQLGVSVGAELKPEQLAEALRLINEALEREAT
jgi:hypothetical protein